LRTTKTWQARGTESSTDEQHHLSHARLLGSAGAASLAARLSSSSSPFPGSENRGLLEAGTPTSEVYYFETIKHISGLSRLGAGGILRPSPDPRTARAAASSLFLSYQRWAFVRSAHANCSRRRALRGFSGGRHSGGRHRGSPSLQAYGKNASCEQFQRYKPRYVRLCSSSETGADGGNCTECPVCTHREHVRI